MSARVAIAIAVALCTLALSPLAHAHPLSPSLLELRERAAGRFDVAFKTPRVRARGLHPRAELPARCHTQGDGAGGANAAADSLNATAHVQRWSVDCGADLEGETIAIAGLQSGRDTGIVRVVRRDGSVVQALVSGDAPAFEVPAARSRLVVAGEFVQLGMRHLWFGLDHLLLLAGLVLLIRGRRALILAVTAFTLGHSVTLALATLGLLRIPDALAEVGIALSLLVVAVELPAAIASGAPGSPWIRRPFVLSGAVGLLHGLGFASALGAAGLPDDALPLALASFNVGVELAQLVVLVPLLFARRLLDVASVASTASAASAASVGASVDRLLRGRLAVAYAIGIPAAYWTLERGALLSQQLGVLS